MITVENLTKRYGSTTAVQDVSFTVQPGSITGFLGPNGAGKSTTLRMLTGLTPPTSGTATITGKRYADLPNPGRVVGVMLDAAAQHPGRTGRETLTLSASLLGVPKSRVDEMLEAVGLEGAAKRRVGQYSLGMRQRLGIAGALLGDPEVLLFDEPVNGLDPEGIRWIRTLMQRLAGEGRTVFVSSHLLSEMAVTATELVVIGRGRLIVQGPTADFVDGATGSTVLVRGPRLELIGRALRTGGFSVTEDGSGDGAALLVAGASTAEVGERVAAAGLVLHELTARRGSLEEAFMEITKQDVEYAAGVPA
jgi:ABC-2 type transport system ATP-binding protein